MKLLVAILWSVTSFNAYADRLNLHINDPDPAVERIDGTWTADVKEVLPLNRVYISNPRLVLDSPLLDQSIFNLGLDGDGRIFVCSHFGYKSVIDVFAEDSGPFEGKYQIGVTILDGKYIYDLELNRTDDPKYYKTVMCEIE